MHITFVWDQVIFNTQCIMLYTPAAQKLYKRGQFLGVHDHSWHMQSALASFSTSFTLTTLSHSGNNLHKFPMRNWDLLLCPGVCVWCVYICNQTARLSGAWHVRHVLLCRVAVGKCFVVLELFAGAGRQLCSHTLTLLLRPDRRLAGLSLAWHQ